MKTKLELSQFSKYSLNSTFQKRYYSIELGFYSTFSHFRFSNETSIPYLSNNNNSKRELFNRISLFCSSNIFPISYRYNQVLSDCLLMIIKVLLKL
ncbi:hypothetical protein DERF_014860 [Dermatophagoides farinae]|uniref:Uncharacterized protein n=1 Tax=Dermatophagoides farinae TaxID=6954 RepID=A0A922HK14_DERFA|nr:hypothetical protein DERF_014860 [Dermatophagoides farinae]